MDISQSNDNALVNVPKYWAAMEILMNFEAKMLADAVTSVRLSGELLEIEAYKASDNCDANEFCLFIKPELCDLSNLQDILEIVTQVASGFGVSFVACRAIGSDYLKQHKTMQSHYGVIDAISRNGREAISSDAEAKFGDIVSSASVDEARIFGAHQFLDEYPSFSADALSIFYDNLNNNKLAGGTHCAVADIRGVPTIVFNGFHPEQLDHYEKTGQAILVFTCRSNTDWKDIRERMTGATNPERAFEGSIRNILLTRKVQLGLPEVSTGRNGVHVSAGPLEGVAELQRFFRTETGDLDLSAITFSKCLADRGMPATVITDLIDNQIIDFDGVKSPSYDVTEELNAREVLASLLET